jgi:hypothetical protein
MGLARNTWIAALAVAALAPAALAGDVTGTVSVGGHVTNFSCTIGSNAGDDTFDLGVLVDLATGLLKQNLAVPSKTLSGSFCTTRSVITVSAAPMSAQSSNGTAPSGFSSQVDYTATASGWAPSPAVYQTGQAVNPAASQIRSTAWSGDILITLTGFTTTGGNTLRLVSDPLYEGAVTITLSVAS